MFRKSLLTAMSLPLITLALHTLANAEVKGSHAGQQYNTLSYVDGVAFDADAQQTARAASMLLSPAYRGDSLAGHRNRLGNPRLRLLRGRGTHRSQQTARAPSMMSPAYRGDSPAGHRNRLGNPRLRLHRGKGKHHSQQIASAAGMLLSPAYRGDSLAGHRNRLGNPRSRHHRGGLSHPFEMNRC